MCMLISHKWITESLCLFTALGLRQDRCIDIDGRHRHFSETWDHPFDPCQTCQCDSSNGITCNKIYCSIPLCVPPSFLVSSEDSCCPSCCKYDDNVISL